MLISVLLNSFQQIMDYPHLSAPKQWRFSKRKLRSSCKGYAAVFGCDLLEGIAPHPGDYVFLSAEAAPPDACSVAAPSNSTLPGTEPFFWVTGQLVPQGCTSHLPPLTALSLTAKSTRNNSNFQATSSTEVWGGGNPGCYKQTREAQPWARVKANTISRSVLSGSTCCSVP